MQALRKTPRDEALANPEQTRRELIEHASEFPTRLQDAIENKNKNPKRQRRQQAVQEPPNNNDEAFVAEIGALLRRMLLLREEQLPGKRGGFDASVDTEEEVEVAIRMFPSVLSKLHEDEIEDVFPIEDHFDHFLIGLPMVIALASPKTIPFVPILARVTKSCALRELPQNVPIGYCPRYFDDLICGHIVPTLVTNDDDDDHQDESSSSTSTTLALVHLIEKELVTKSMVTSIVYDVVSHNLLWNADRLRLLIELDPETLQYPHEYWDPMHTYNSLFSLYVGCHFSSGDRAIPKQNKARILTIFEMLFEAGMKHYPKEMGFFFCSNTRTRRNENLPSVRRNAIELVCDICGRDDIFDMVQGVLEKTLFHGSNHSSKPEGNNHKSLRTVVWAVATNQGMLLDALYLLVRADPLTVCAFLQN